MDCVAVRADGGVEVSSAAAKTFLFGRPMFLAYGENVTTDLVSGSGSRTLRKIGDELDSKGCFANMFSGIFLLNAAPRNNVSPEGQNRREL